jgi:hypothetical protein
MAEESYTLDTFDPYDLWSTQIGIKVRDRYYRGQLTGKVGAVSLGLLDWLLPHISRRITHARARSYPIVIAHEVLRLNQLDQLDENIATLLLKRLAASATNPSGESGWSWGLGFAWMSKNGLYPDNIPFVTHTPYVMEALLILANYRDLNQPAKDMFCSTWDFLESLKVMHQDDTRLALSYAPVEEPRMVINANSYAAYAYALHAIHGEDENKNYAIHKVSMLLQWITEQQHENGAWDYYADKESGNFIDCFHSCFVVKNLLKTQSLLPQVSSLTDDSTRKGWEFIQSKLYNSGKGLCRRFIKKHINDPYTWDLYDQAEYLNLLIKFGHIEQARQFEKNVSNCFSKGNDWYCKVDILGHQWGKNFQRWGIAPFMLAKSHLISRK